MAFGWRCRAAVSISSARAAGLSLTPADSRKRAIRSASDTGGTGSSPTHQAEVGLVGGSDVGVAGQGHQVVGPRPETGILTVHHPQSSPLRRPVRTRPPRLRDRPAASPPGDGDQVPRAVVALAERRRSGGLGGAPPEEVAAPGLRRWPPPGREASLRSLWRRSAGARGNRRVRRRPAPAAQPWRRGAPGRYPAAGGRGPRRTPPPFTREMTIPSERPAYTSTG